MAEPRTSSGLWFTLAALGLGGLFVYRRAELRVAETRAQRTLRELEATADRREADHEGDDRAP